MNPAQHSTAPDTIDQQKSIRQKFREQYHQEPLMVRSPGRINLIGEHTDYNEGFVMPAAIDRELIFAIGPASGEDATLFSLKHDESVTFRVADPKKMTEPLWPNYLLGVARRFMDKGYPLKPFHCIVGGDVPTGAGLSSSAALECGFAFALNLLHAFNIPKLEMIHMAQWAEHQYAGVKCGIMDQFASMMGVEGKAFVLDCRSLSYRYFPVALKDYTIVLCDSMVKHSLANSAYNERREECEIGVKMLREVYPAIRSLRDASLEILEENRSKLPGKVYDRCTYVVQENNRVLAAAEDLRAGNLKSFGQKMFASHEGLSNQYEVSCPELDFLVEQARKSEGTLGARMMGGGFGGCTINLIPKVRIDSFITKTSEAYHQRFQQAMKSYIISLRNGTSVIP